MRQSESAESEAPETEIYSFQPPFMTFMVNNV